MSELEYPRMTDLVPYVKKVVVTITDMDDTVNTYTLESANGEQGLRVAGAMSRYPMEHQEFQSLPKFIHSYDLVGFQLQFEGKGFVLRLNQ